MEGVGSISNPDGANVWPHEMRTAEAFAAAGHDVTFVRKSDNPHERTADMIMDGELWEMKAPRSSNVKAVERNLKRARWQSPNIVFDSRRMGNLPDHAVERALRKWSREIDGIRHVLFVNRHGEVIDII